MARKSRGKVGRHGATRGMHGRHHVNTEPNPVGRPGVPLVFGGAPRPKKRRY